MRLKILFFPIVVVVSLAIFIGFIWPEIQSIIKINEEKIAKNKELNTVKEKQAAIELIGKSITDNINQKDVVNSYLPEKMTEERVLSSLNFLAGDANVSLINVSLVDAAVSSAMRDADIMSANPLLGGIASATPVDPATQVIDPNTGLPIVEEVIKLQNLTMKISVVGEYAKVKAFVDGLQHMPVINSIASIDISKKTAEQQDQNTANPSLIVDITADFGYMPFAKVNRQQIEKIKNGLSIDTGVIDTLSTYRLKKSDMNENIGQMGKENPFSAN
jgi:hypothetical protein